ncbi:MAG: hypothetical protein OXG85_09280 [Chloroflexi bacterium]|nr:hypothetical protein [Chloroflexota bacterium]
MVGALGLLLWLFRQIERWLHQHIFKVGWLLTNNYQITTVLYYIVFLPGILLHEFTLWLAAGLLRVRAVRAIQFPATQEIGELRLNFVRLSPQSGLLRLSLIRLAPFVAGLCALWLIAAQVLDLDQIVDAAKSGELEDLAGAAAKLLRTADFWLWFYFAFTFANTMFSDLPKGFSARHRSATIILTGAIPVVAWSAASSIELSLAQAIERLTSSLALITLQVIVMNIVILAGLGLIEALIERVTGKSATFSDGKMLTMSRQEAQEWKAAQAQKRRAARQRGTERSKEKVIASVYELKLPIPGPPGREPVSRSIVTVMDLAEARADAAAAARADNMPEPPTIQLDQQSQAPPAPPADPGDAPTASQPVKTRKYPYRQSEATRSERQARADDENAPFSRPFAGSDSKVDTADGNETDGGEAADASPFSRPFNMRTRPSVDLDLDSDSSPARPSDGRINPTAATGESAPATPSSRTRPAPKPSAGAKNKPHQLTRADSDELSYEPLDADGI